MINDMLILQNKFQEIKRKKWIKSVKKGPTGIGATLEHLLGCEENSLEIPDFNSFEVKAKRKFSESYISLFNMTPSGKYYHETERLKNLYGYPDKILKQYKVLNNSIYTSKTTWIGNRFQFILKVNKEKKIVKLCIFDRNNNLIEDFINWDFDSIKEKLYRKLKNLAYFNAYTKFYKNEEYFYYYKIQFFRLKNFETFINLINDGTIRINFKIGVFRFGKRLGQIHDHGTSFEIKECDLLKLYEKLE